MTDISKFQSDVQRILKRDRQENSGKSDFMRVAPELQKLFSRSAACPDSLSASVFEYWENEYVHNSADFQNEPTQDHLEKLSALLSFLEDDREDTEILTKHDWQELSDIVKYEADDLPLETLQSLMQTLVEKGAY